MPEPTSDKGAAGATSTPTTSTTTSTPSTGTTPATTSTASAPTRSTSARQALERAAGSAASSPATAVSAEGVKTTEQPTATKQGPTAAEATIQLGAEGDDSWFDRVPESRRGRVLEVHTKRAVEEFKKQMGLPPETTPEQIQAAFEIASRYKGNPIQYVKELIEEIQSDPELAAQLGGDDDDTSDDIPEPQPDLEATDAQGRVIGKAYSAPRQAEREKWFEARLMRNLQQTLKPYMGWVDKARSRETLENIRAESRTTAQSIVEEARVNLPHFKDNEVEIKAALAAIPKARKLQIGAVAAMYEAYNRVMKEKVLPTLEHRTTQETIEDQRRRAAAGGDAIVPSTATTTPAAKKPRNPTELAAHMAKLAGQ